MAQHIIRRTTAAPETARSQAAGMPARRSVPRRRTRAGGSPSRNYQGD
ncbi:hypothetical protein BURMUCGD1_6249 [Burkholderia multivorans CGD1]|nr:hypothetical protein BURMUCGD1_6249 [Burkholderia multivorans CGD1]